MVSPRLLHLLFPAVRFTSLWWIFADSNFKNVQLQIPPNAELLWQSGKADKVYLKDRSRTCKWLGSPPLSIIKPWMAIFNPILEENDHNG